MFPRGRSVAGWRGWQYLQSKQAAEAAAVFEELDQAATAGDAERTARLFNDLKTQYPKTAYAAHGALLAGKVQYLRNQTDPAIASLSWAAESAADGEFRSLARLRLAGILVDLKRHDEALKWLSTGIEPEFEALAADRRGDVLMAQGKRSEAVTAYQAAWKGLDAALDYRRVVQTKLEVLGMPPEAAPAAQPAAAASAKEGA